jgi:hypothetical protein
MVSESAKPTKARLSRADFTSGPEPKPSNSTIGHARGARLPGLPSGEMRSISPDN